MINPIEKKFQKLDEIEHCLKRPGMWVGSTKNADELTYFLNEEKQFEFRSANLNPGFLKIFDEIISNSADEHRRNPKLNIIDVTVDQSTGKILIRDNGGIPVVMHKEHDQWVPELIFSNLRAGSNFDDTESRLVAGTNGVGSTLTNIFSTLFFVQTCDGKNAFSQKFTSNMRQKEEAKVVPAKDNRGYTNILYIPDFTQFGMTRIDDDHMNAMKKRCADVAACNPKLRVSFNGHTFKFESFESYCKLYVPDIISESSERWRISVGPSNGAMQHVSFVNGVYTKDGGTHVDFITNQIVESVRIRLKKKHKIELKPSEIKNHMFVFVSADIVNSSFSSQTKEKLITDPRDFGSKHELSEKFMKAVCSSEMIQLILDWAQQKNAADEKKALRDLNKKIDREKVLKLIEAKSSQRETCSLQLYEGDSAVSAFRKFRDPMTQAAFPLRGKFLNVAGVPATKILANKEVQSILNAVGLRMGEEAKNLRYGKILIYSDADPDGDSIAGLLINFFGRFWPELFEKKIICRVMTPLVVAVNKKTRLSFYTNAEFVQWESSLGSKTKEWNISYKKGLAALEDEDYSEIIKNPRLFALSQGTNLKKSLEDWFGDDATPRKMKIMGVKTIQELNDAIAS